MDHVFVLYDRGSNSVWYPNETALEAVGGDRKGSEIPFMDEPAPVPLGDWLDAHPDSTVLLPTEQDYKRINRPYLGIRLEEGENGVVVSRVGEGSPAEEAGVQIGDIVRSLAGEPVVGRRDLRPILTECSAGDTVDLVIVRDGVEKTLSVALRKP